MTYLLQQKRLKTTNSPSFCFQSFLPRIIMVTIQKSEYSLPFLWTIYHLQLVIMSCLEKEMAIHSSIIAWKIPWTEEPGKLQSIGSQGVGHDWATSLFFQGASVFLISQLQSLSAVILEPKKIVSQYFHCFPIYLSWSDGTRYHDLSFLNVEF